MAFTDERSTDNPTADVAPRVNSAAWGGPFILGLLMTILGIVALGAAFFTSLVSAILFGALLAGAGIMEVISAFRERKSGGPFWLYLLSGILSVVVGLFILVYPAAGLGAMTLLLAGYFFASGLFHTITSVMDRYARWGWDFFYGAVSIVLGIIIMRQWPISAVWLVGTLVGIGIFFRGIALMAGALTVRRVLRSGGPTTPASVAS
ncbi:HdeD family acid-resistance protein [Myxococcus sp. Y35]|uniref:HdeD family acid-resistance protein n=1 Tax=Pseudomyxococcus flavus TaxID=3115648 RepID=UPI003CF76F60